MCSNNTAKKVCKKYDSTVHPEAKVAYDSTVQFINDYRAGAEPRWLSYLGTSGVGKTQLAKNIKRTLGEGAFFNWADICDKLREWDFGIVDYCSRVDLLIIDDIGAEKKSDLTQSKLVQILNARLGKWTVLTSNLTHLDIAQAEARISSRMVRGENKIITFRECPDYSLKNYKN